LFDQVLDIASNEGFASSQSQFLDAKIYGDPGDKDDLFIGEQFLLPFPDDVLVRNAVEASEVASVGDRDAKIADRARELIL
jgi:hypothetical protein